MAQFKSGHPVLHFAMKHPVEKNELLNHLTLLFERMKYHVFLKEFIEYSILVSGKNVWTFEELAIRQKWDIEEAWRDRGFQLL